MFQLASSVGNQTRIRDFKTSTGTKDTFLDHFIDTIATVLKKKRGAAAKEALAAHLATLPANVFSPVWRLKGSVLRLSSGVAANFFLPGLDPHADTPVEILHTVLLGFVKYFWRDTINNQLKNNSDKKELLKTRLQSLDTTGLGIDRLSGHTLVQYAGSLTGRDFRAIAQVAPFVLYDLVSKPCYNAWVSLSNLVPLVWQPNIPNIDEHAVSKYIILPHFGVLILTTETA
jgi:hypothetical protein